MAEVSDYKHIYLLPGFDGTGILFQPLAEAFGYRCRTTTLPFEDEVTLEDYVQSVSERLPARNVILLAESFSCPIALTLMARYPARFKAAILSAGYARSPFGTLMGLSRWITESFLGERPLQNLLLNKFNDPEDVPALIRKRIEEIEDLVPPRVVKTRFNMVAGLNTLPLLSRIAAPVLYLRALRDKLVSARLREELFENIPQICTKELDAPHLLLQTRPRECADSILNFLELDSMESAPAEWRRSTA